MSSQLYYHRLLPLLDPEHIDEAMHVLDEFAEYTGKLEVGIHNLAKTNKDLFSAIEDIESDMEDA